MPTKSKLREETDKAFDEFFEKTMGISKPAAQEMTNMDREIIADIERKYKAGENIPEHWRDLIEYKGQIFKANTDEQK